MTVYSRLGAGGYPRPPYGSFAGRVAAITSHIVETITYLQKPIDAQLAEKGEEQPKKVAMGLSGIPNWAKGIFDE